MADVATSNFRIKSGDTLPYVRVILESRNNRPIQDEDLEHLETVEFVLEPIEGGAAILTDDADLVDAAKSEFIYEWGAPAGDPGKYFGFFVLTFDNGHILTVPNAGPDSVDMFVVEITP